MEEDRTKVASLSTKPMSCILSVAEDCGVCISVYLYTPVRTSEVLACPDSALGGGVLAF